MRYALAISLIVLAGAVNAQDKPAAGAAPAAEPPAATAPAANAPAGTAPATPAAPAAPSGEKTVTIRVPSGGSFSAYVEEIPSAMKTIQDKGELPVPATGGYTVYVLDPQSGYAARKTVTAGAPVSELSFASPDFRLVQKVRVEATGKDGKPIAQGIVTLTDGGKNTSRKIIQPSSLGAAEFDFVVSGAGTVTVVPEGGSATSKEVTIDLRRGETTQTIPVAMPEVMAVVEPPAAPELTVTEPAPAGDAAAPAPAAQPAPAATPAAPAAPLPQPAPAGDIGQTIIGFIFLAILLGGAYLYMRNRGITVDMLLKKVGVQPEAVVAVGGAAAPVSPGAPPPPPPVVSDPNQCEFCGQMKDPSGNCACTVTPGSSAPAYSPAPGNGAAGGGPRLIGTAGAYMGHIFPISGTAVLGREPSNPVPLDQDTTASRRHAQITADAGGYRIQDLGSSNGTYVNGARVTEAPLHPGDEVAIGGTRFRFEV